MQYIPGMCDQPPTQEDSMHESQQTPTAHCSPELADWLDPTGALRRSGLLIADCPSIGLPSQVPGSKEIRFNP